MKKLTNKKNSFLVLGRKQDQSVMIDFGMEKQVKVTVDNKDHFGVTFEASNDIEVNHNDSAQTKNKAVVLDFEGKTVTVMKGDTNKWGVTRLKFEAPKDVVILREELLAA